MIKWNLRKLRNNQESTWLFLDIVMLALLSFNLAWLLFDSLFSVSGFANLVAGALPGFHDWYAQQVHPNYLRYDLYFVAIFLAEFSVRWTVAVRRRTYRRWYWYPFIHWYELLGCIPLAGFRLLRLLRVISMVYRLQRLGVLDLVDTAPTRFIMRYYRILIEELADKVVLRVLSGVQEEVRQGHPVWRRIIQDVVIPRKRMLAEELGRRLAVMLEHNYPPHRDHIRQYVDDVIAEAIAESRDVKRFGKIPMLGSFAVVLLERSIADIVFGVVDQSAMDIQTDDYSEHITDLIEAGLDTFLEQQDGMDEATNEMLIDALDVIQERVAVNRRQRRYDAF